MASDNDKKKVKKFLKLIAGSLNVKKEVTRKRLKSAFLKATENLPDGEFKTLLLSDSKGCTEKLQRYVNDRQGKEESMETLETTKLKPLSNNHQQKVKAKKLGTRKSAVEKTREIEDGKKEERNSQGKKHSSEGSYLQKLAIQSRADKRSYSFFMAVMKDFLCEIEKKYEMLNEGEQEKATQLAAEIQTSLSVCHLHYQQLDKNSSTKGPSYQDIVASLLSMYIETTAKSTRKQKKKKKVGQCVCSFVCYIAEQSHLLDILLQLTEIKQEDEKVVLPLVRRCLKLMSPEGSSGQYLKYMLTVASMHKVFAESAQDLLSSAKTVPAPAGFMEWLEEASPGVAEQLPNDSKFVKFQITKFLLEDLTDELVSDMLDIFTLSDEDDIEDNQTEDTKDEPERSPDTMLKNMADTPLFFLDKAGMNIKEPVNESQQDIEDEMKSEEEEGDLANTEQAASETIEEVNEMLKRTRNRQRQLSSKKESRIKKGRDDISDSQSGKSKSLTSGRISDDERSDEASESDVVILSDDDDKVTIMPRRIGYDMSRKSGEEIDESDDSDVVSDSCESDVEDKGNLLPKVSMDMRSTTRKNRRDLNILSPIIEDKSVKKSKRFSVGRKGKEEDTTAVNLCENQSETPRKARRRVSGSGKMVGGDNSSVKSADSSITARYSLRKRTNSEMTDTSDACDDNIAKSVGDDTTGAEAKVQRLGENSVESDIGSGSGRDFTKLKPAKSNGSKSKEASGATEVLDSKSCGDLENDSQSIPSVRSPRKRRSCVATQTDKMSSPKVIRKVANESTSQRKRGQKTPNVTPAKIKGDGEKTVGQKSILDFMSKSDRKKSISNSEDQLTGSTGVTQRKRTMSELSDSSIASRTRHQTSMSEISETAMNVLDTGLEASQPKSSIKVKDRDLTSSASQPADDASVEKKNNRPSRRSSLRPKKV